MWYQTVSWLANSHNILVNRRRPVLVILDTAHEALADALVDDKDNLGCDLRAEEESLFHAVVTAGGSRAGRTVETGIVLRRSVGGSLLFPLGEVLGWPYDLDGGRGLRMAGGAVVRQGRVHQRRSWRHAGGGGVVGVGGSDEKRIYTTALVVHWAGKALRCRSVRSAGGKGCGEIGGDFRGEDGAGWRENELLSDCADQGLSEACKMLVDETVIVKVDGTNP